MIRFVISSLALFYCPLLRAQEIKPLTFDSTIAMDSTKKEVLYQRARIWLTDYFVSSKAVIEMDDKESGVIIGKGILKSSYTYRMMGTHTDELNLRITLKISLKDNKYKYEVYNITTDPVKKSDGMEIFGPLTTSKECPHDYPMIGKKKEDEMWLSAIESSTKSINTMLFSLRDAMSKNSDF